jgi:hypothetical protein
MFIHLSINLAVDMLFPLGGQQLAETFILKRFMY